MKHRAAALQKLAEGLDEIVASHAEKLAKRPVETSEEHHEEYEIKAENPEEEEKEEMEESEEEEEGEESKPLVKGELNIEEMASGGSSITPLPEAPPEEDEMEQAKKQIAERLSKKPVAIRRA